MLLVSALMGCANTEQTNTLTYQQKLAQQQLKYDTFLAENDIEPVKKISTFRYNGWRYLDDEHLLLSASPTRPYLITLAQPCREIKWANALAINYSGSVLMSRFDSVYVPAELGRTPARKCIIEQIHPLDKQQKKALLAWI